jgi:multimeric flavodoxin WrbA
LTPFLKLAAEADVLLLGSPLYFGMLSGGMKCLFERLVFPYLPYSKSIVSTFPRSIKVGAIYTMNTTEAQFQTHPSRPILERVEAVLERAFGHAESMYSFDTCQFRNYSRILSDVFDPVHKQQRREKAFPKDCQRAFDLGARLAA